MRAHERGTRADPRDPFPGPVTFRPSPRSVRGLALAGIGALYTVWIAGPFLWGGRIPSWDTMFYFPAFFHFQQAALVQEGMFNWWLPTTLEGIPFCLPLFVTYPPLFPSNFAVTATGLVNRLFDLGVPLWTIYLWVRSGRRRSHRWSRLPDRPASSKAPCRARGRRSPRSIRSTLHVHNASLQVEVAHWLVLHAVLGLPWPLPHAWPGGWRSGPGWPPAQCRCRG